MPQTRCEGACSLRPHHTRCEGAPCLRPACHARFFLQQMVQLL